MMKHTNKIFTYDFLSHNILAKIRDEEKFTPRQIDVAACLPSKRSSDEIGKLLSIQCKGVEAHKHNHTTPHFL